QTLDPLLLLPIDRGEILIAKLLGALLRGWPWLALLALDIVTGALLGAYHPFAAVLLALAPWPMVLFIAGLGLALSVHAGTVLRANLVLLIVVVLLVAATFVFPMGMGPLSYLEPYIFSLFGRAGQHGLHGDVWTDIWRGYPLYVGNLL